MCATCGCDADDVRVTRLPALPALPAHDHAHPHDAPTRTVPIETAVLAKNDSSAERNRTWLRTHGLAAVNLMSSPGSGKTTLLERTVRELAGSTPVCVVEGDQETTLDAERIRATGAPVVQVNTGTGCHLDADMVWRALQELRPARGSLVVVENVGNLVCPALFDLGEARRVVVMSVTEGADKPLKYPHMFTIADLVVVNKTDLLPYVDFDLAHFAAAVRAVNPRARQLLLSATTGDGLNAWYAWLVATLDPRPDPE